MPRFLTVFILLCAAATSTYAQAINDTIFYENFNKIPKITIKTLPFLSDTSMVIYDKDGSADANGRSGNWFFSNAFAPQDSLAQKVFASSSWLANALDGNRNYLVLPRFWVLDNATTLSWKSAPYQAPSYLDGYNVVVSVSGSNGAADFTDTIFRAAQMIRNANGSIGTGKNVATYSFSNGYIHANGLTDTLYFKNRPATALDTNIYNCVLEPHTVSLAAYNGRRISVAFVHQSDDDNMISIDDIYVKGRRVSLSNTEINDNIGLQVRTYPNPAHNDINIEYQLKNTTPITIIIYDAQGKMVWQQPTMVQLSGVHYQKINVAQWAHGSYIIKINAAGVGVFSQAVVVQ